MSDFLQRVVADFGNNEGKFRVLESIFSINRFQELKLTSQNPQPRLS